MNEHTLGPWELGEDGVWLGSVYGEDGLRIAFVYGEWDIDELRPREEAEANARLIAAAPDSHAANLAFLAALDEAFGIKATHDDDFIYDELPSSGIARAYFMARDAIAKVAGESA